MGLGKREKWTYRATSQCSSAETPINQIDVDSATSEPCVRQSTVDFNSRRRCFYPKNMKGDRKKGTTFFKKGHKLLHRKECRDIPVDNNDTNSVRYVRPTPEEADLVDQNPIQPLAIKLEASSDKPITTYKLLRSLNPKQTVAPGEGQTAMEKRLSGEGYRLIHTGKLWEMLNTVMKQHKSNLNKPCSGRLGFDFSKEEQWGSCWRERVICDSCSYVSPMFKLYEEVKVEKRGRRAATANVGLSIGMTQTPAGPSSVMKLYASCNIPPPTRQGLQKSANAVNKIITDTNIKDMKARRQQLKTINRLRNRPEHEICIQADGQYNNNLYSGVGRTPFQPGTQCTYTVAENITHKKQIIALETVNKLCSKHGFHSIEDEKCDIKSGTCSATASMETNIGDEEEWAKSCLKDLKKDDLEVKYLVTDPDTAAYRAAEKLFSDGITKTKPEHQIDTRHLSQNHRKFMKNNSRVLSMMPGHTQAFRLLLRNRFSVDMSVRCHAEHSAIHELEKGDYDKIKPRISRCVAAIKQCYAGDPSRCKANSSVCNGEINNNWIVKSAFLTQKIKIDLTKEGNEEILADCIDYRLGVDMLQKTRLNLNSQKVEATNRAIRRSLPKTVTFSRNFPGRAHSAIHSVNNGVGDSICKLCAAAGCPINEGSRVAKSLRSAQRHAESKKERERSLQFKIKRKLRRARLYSIYEKHAEKKKYIKGLLLKQRKSKMPKIPSAKARRKTAATLADHVYAHTRNRSKKLVKYMPGYGPRNRPPPTGTECDPCLQSGSQAPNGSPASKLCGGRGDSLQAFRHPQLAWVRPILASGGSTSMSADVKTPGSPPRKSNSLDPDKTPSYSASGLDSSCLSNHQ